jgi:prefoldin subunit 5
LSINSSSQINMLTSIDIKRMKDDNRVAELKLVIEQRDTTIEFLKRQCDFLKTKCRESGTKRRELEDEINRLWEENQNLSIIKK